MFILNIYRQSAFAHFRDATLKDEKHREISTQTKKVYKTARWGDKRSLSNKIS